MNTRVLALMCTLSAVGCGSSSTQQPQNATSRTVAVTDNQSHTATVMEPPSATTNDTVETSSRDSNPSRDDRTATTASSFVAATPPTPATPVVTPNPGVADGTKAAENTKTNARDRQNTLTPMDQGNSTAETTITANIRKGIVGDKTLSFTGKNVKIVTIGTKVTLRGPVKNGTERATIEGIAKRTAGVSEVDNQLEVSN